MAYTAVGSLVLGTGTTSVLSVTPAAAGNIIFLSISQFATATTASSVAGGGVTTWIKVASLSNATLSVNHELWYGVVTTAGAATITVSWTGSPSSPGLESMEFSAGLGAGTSWTIDGVQSGSATQASGTTCTWPTRTPTGTSLLYGSCCASGTPGFSAGSGTPANVYTGGRYNVLVYSLAVTAADTPSLTHTSGAAVSIDVLMKASLAVAGGTVPQTRRRQDTYMLGR